MSKYALAVKSRTAVLHKIFKQLIFYLSYLNAYAVLCKDTAFCIY